MNELQARVQALLRRTGRTAAPAGQPEINGWRIDLAARTCRRGDEAVTISDTEARLLAFFVENPRRTLERADILEEVWGMESDPTPRTVDTFVWKLRRLFESDPENPRIFLTVRAAGYRFEPQ
jgi:two-component system alkaline phosphatase synthesis response regulator PhoP